MSETTKSRLISGTTAVALLALGIAIGWLGSGEATPASPTLEPAPTPQQARQDRPAPDLASEQRIDGLPASMQPWRDPDDPTIQLLADDWDYYYRRNDWSTNPDREAGPINVQRYTLTTTKAGFPTYFGLPLAMTPEDLEAGDVDVAIVGLPSDFNPTGGQGWAANQLRFNLNYDHAGVGHDKVTNLNYFDALNVVDYGNGPQHPSFMTRNFAAQALVLKEILSAGAIPMAVGGDHGTQVATIMAVVDHFGPQEIAFVHFDAHTDLASGRLGLFTHGGAARRFAWEQGWVRGEDMHTIGLRDTYDDPERLEFMRDIGDQYHFMIEFEREGFDQVWNDILEELEGKRLYVSVDVDFLDPAHAPGVSNPAPGGLTSANGVTMMRELAIANEIVAIDFVEYSPLLDDRHYNTGNVINRLMRSFLAGLAARNQGITDPKYVHPDVIR